MMSGSAMRLAVPTRLNESSSKSRISAIVRLTCRITHGWPHDRRTCDHGASERRLGPSLPGPDMVVGPHGQSSVELTTRMVYLLERSVTLSTCWSPVCLAGVSYLTKQSLPDAEITAELPVLQTTFDRGWGDLDGVQTFQ